MPYKSARQRAYMHIHLPGIAARWDKEYGGAVGTNYAADLTKKKAALNGMQKGAAFQRASVEVERKKRTAARAEQGTGRGQRNVQTGTGRGQRNVQTGSGSGARVKSHPPGKPFRWANGTFHTRPQGKQFRSNYRNNYRPGGALRNAPQAGPNTVYRYM